MHISDTGLDLVKHFEGLFLTAYLDPVGVWTIGYGNTGPEATSGNTITEQRADELLRQDMADAEDAVSRHITVTLSQKEFDALTSFAFNVGGGNLWRSTLRRKLNAGDRQGAADELLRWNKGRVNGVLTELAGLTRRRKSEREFFLTGNLNFFDGRGIVDPDEAEATASGGGGIPTTPLLSGDGSGSDDFPALVASWNLKHFSASELLTKGGSHSATGSPAFGLNTDPPRDKWTNIKPSIVALDQLRNLLGASIHLLSVYRSPAYNSAVGGVSQSQHMEFKAIDFYASTGSPSHWASVLKELRSQGVFSGGIGIYDTFVHIDCRGVNVDF